MRRAKRVLGGSRTWPGQSRYIHSVDEEVKNDYQERTYAKDVQSTVGGIDKWIDKGEST